MRWLKETNKITQGAAGGEEDEGSSDDVLGPDEDATAPIDWDKKRFAVDGKAPSIQTCHARTSVKYAVMCMKPENEWIFQALTDLNTTQVSYTVIMVHIGIKKIS